VSTSHRDRAVGDRVKCYSHPDFYNEDGTIVEKLNSVMYVVALDRLGAVKLPIGSIMDWWSPEQEALAITNATADGWALEDARIGRWTRPPGYGLIGCGTSSLVEMYAHNHPPCVECGSFIQARSDRPTLDWCQYCGFWLDRIANLSKFLIVDVDGVPTSYADAGRRNVSARDKSHLGFGGHEFTIERTNPDGTTSTWTTNNLFGQGAVPEHFRDRMPVNARFIKPDEETL
jgi:hypothetical protein